jgi:RsiW-degrading membrane proteinase PrsW (M82 family)
VNSLKSALLQKLFESNVPDFVLATIIPVLFLIFMIKDRQSRYILSFFCWGVLSVLFAFIFNELALNEGDQSARLGTSIAPIIEETLKALPVILLFARNKVADKRIVIYCAMASGIGFSIQETLFYLQALTMNSGLSSIVPVVIRTLTTCLMHGMATAVIGFSIIMTAGFKDVRASMIMGMLALAATIHSLFNLMIGTRLAVMAMVMPAALYFAGLALASGMENEKVFQGGEPNARQEEA